MKLLTYLLISITFFTSTSALAHSKLLSHYPENNSVIETMPEHLAFNFNKSMRLAKVTLIDQDANKIKIKSLGKESKQEHAISLDNIPYGLFNVKWIALGKDGHKMEGAFTFMLHENKMTHSNSMQIFYDNFQSLTNSLESEE